MNAFYSFVGGCLVVGLIAPRLGADPLSGFLIVSFAVILILVEWRERQNQETDEPESKIDRHPIRGQPPE